MVCGGCDGWTAWQTNQLREDKADVERELEELRIKFRQTEAGAQLLNDKMKLYAGEDGIDVEVRRELLPAPRQQPPPACSSGRHTNLLA